MSSKQTYRTSYDLNLFSTLRVKTPLNMDNSGAHAFQENDIQLFKSGNFADGTIKCQGRTWKVHRSLLASRLKFFKSAFYGLFAVNTSKDPTFYPLGCNSDPLY